MGYTQETVGDPFIAASAIPEGAVVGAVIAASALAERVVIASSAGYGFPIGFALATAASPGDPIAVQTEGIAKGICAAGGSIRAGQLVAAASGGKLVEFVPSAASGGAPRYAVGFARQSAVAEDRFAVHIHPVVSL